MKPCLFKTDMVRAILEDRKTVTRRVVKEPWFIEDEDVSRMSGYAMHRGYDYTHGMPYPDSIYHPSDILYVRETWCPFDSEHVINGVKYAYKADSTPESERVRKDFGYKWHSSVHMPWEAARIFLRVTDVGVERLQDITLDQLRAEGMKLFVTPSECKNMMNRFGAVCDFERKKKDFSTLWDSTIKPADRALYGWEANPYVWVIEFERCEKPEGD